MEEAKIKNFAAEFDPQPFRLNASRSKPNQAVVSVRSTMLNQKDESVYVFSARALVFKRP